MKFTFKNLRGILNYLRLSTVYVGIGKKGTNVYIGRGVRLGSRRNLWIGSGAVISDHCRILAGKKTASISLGERTFVHEFSILRAFDGEIHIGADCSINSFCVLLGHGGISIGKGVRIATHTTIVASQHVISDTGIPIHEQGVSGRGIAIEEDVWIGANCTILDGVRVGKGTVVGAGAVVTKDVPPYAVVGGVPARVIRIRRTAEGQRQEGHENTRHGS